MVESLTRQDRSDDFLRCSETARLMQLPAKAQCACGECQLTITAQPFVSYTCHCDECKKLTSSAFATLIQLPFEAIGFQPERITQITRDCDSGSTTTLHRCAACGCPMFLRNAARPGIGSVLVGNLEQPEAVAVDAHIWTQRKLPWVTLPADHEIYDFAGDWRSRYRSDPERLSGAG